MSARRDRERDVQGTIPRAGTAIADRHGFSLIEVLIGMIVSVFVVTATLSLLNTQRKSDRTTRLRSEVQQNARYTLDMITRDLMEAGQGMDPNPVFGAVGASDGGTSTPDTLYVIYADAETPIHFLEAPPNGQEKAVIEVKITCGDLVQDLAVGDLVYLASGSARGVARIDQLTRNQSGSCGGNPLQSLGTLTLDVRPVDGEGHGWVLQGNAAGAALLHVNAAVYFVDKSDPANPMLARASEWDGSWDPIPIAHGISDLEVELQFAGGTTGQLANGSDSNPNNDYDDIDTIEIRVKAQARRKDKDIQGGKKLFEQEYAVSVSPRNQLYTRNRN